MLRPLPCREGMGGAVGGFLHAAMVDKSQKVCIFVI